MTKDNHLIFEAYQKQLTEQFPLGSLTQTQNFLPPETFGIIGGVPGFAAQKPSPMSTPTYSSTTPTTTSPYARTTQLFGQQTPAIQKRLTDRLVTQYQVNPTVATNLIQDIFGQITSFFSGAQGIPGGSSMPQMPAPPSAGNSIGKLAIGGGKLSTGPATPMAPTMNLGAGFTGKV